MHRRGTTLRLMQGRLQLTKALARMTGTDPGQDPPRTVEVPPPLNGPLPDTGAAGATPETGGGTRLTKQQDHPSFQECITYSKILLYIFLAITHT